MVLKSTNRFSRPCGSLYKLDILVGSEEDKDFCELLACNRISCIANILNANLSKLLVQVAFLIERPGKRNVLLYFIQHVH